MTQDQYCLDFIAFQKAGESDSRFVLDHRDIYPVLNEDTDTTAFDAHYVYHTSWAARVLAEVRPKVHVDISSSLYFSGLVSAFIPVDFYDYRPVNLRLSGLTSNRADLNELPFSDGSVESISCMHVVEHIGLGRYGDPIDPLADLRAMSELKRVLAPGGHLLFVTPVGKSRIQFNAHRIYSFEMIREAFSGMELKEFAIVPDDGLERGLIRNAAPELVAAQRYACGCFHFTK